jgi:hypothetical protein
VDVNVAMYVPLTDPLITLKLTTSPDGVIDAWGLVYHPFVLGWLNNLPLAALNSNLTV